MNKKEKISDLYDWLGKLGDRVEVLEDLLLVKNHFYQPNYKNPCHDPVEKIEKTKAKSFRKLVMKYNYHNEPKQLYTTGESYKNHKPLIDKWESECEGFETVRAGGIFAKPKKKKK